MKRLATAIAATILLSLLAATAVNAQFTVTGGKYSKYTLWSQYVECNDFVCHGCMRNWFPDPANPFDNSNSDNCEGVLPFVNWYFYLGSKMADTDWVHFVVLSEANTLRETVAACDQRYQVDVQCTVAANGPDYDVMGAYLIGSEMQIYLLNDFIVRNGIRSDAEYDWTELRRWIALAVDDYALTLWLPLDQRWGLVFYASMLYWAELTTADPVARAERSVEEELALTCMAHAFVCWQSEEWENGRAIIDLIGPSGIEDWPFQPSETPDFVYTMWVNLRDLIGIDVSVAQRSWGDLKSLYR